MAIADWSWQGALQRMGARDFICGHCGRDITSNLGYIASRSDPPGNMSAYICHRCEKLNFFDEEGRQFPGAPFGDTVKDIDDPLVYDLYEEARRSFSANVYTSSVMCCRKVLMNIAVSKGAQPGLQYVAYVDFLSKNNYIPPDTKG
jgi:hypothetical protein